MDEKLIMTMLSITVLLLSMLMFGIGLILKVNYTKYYRAFYIAGTITLLFMIYIYFKGVLDVITCWV